MQVTDDLGTAFVGCCWKKKSQINKTELSLIQMLPLMAGTGYELFMPPFSKFSGQPKKERNQLQSHSLKTD